MVKMVNTLNRLGKTAILRQAELLCNRPTALCPNFPHWTNLRYAHNVIGKSTLKELFLR